MGIWNLLMRAAYNSIFLAKLEQFTLGQIPMLYTSVFVYIYTSIILFLKNNFFCSVGTCLEVRIIPTSLISEYKWQ